VREIEKEMGMIQKCTIAFLLAGLLTTGCASMEQRQTKGSAAGTLPGVAESWDICSECVKILEI
jgi:hypothetical protein